jgi:uncharacterized protein (TIGR02594 family)
MTQADRIAAALRPLAPRGALKADEIPLINALGEAWDRRLRIDPAGGPGVIVNDPAWIVEARKRLGEREIVGPQNNGWIAQGWARLGASWFNNDETPWCGYFVAHCLNAAGLPFPGKGEFARALRWATWGTAVTPRLGAIGVKSRKGGGHVFFLVGVTADGQRYKALGGNQGNCVSIIDIAKADVAAIRWPQGAPETAINLPIMPAGTIGASEA